MDDVVNSTSGSLPTTAAPGNPFGRRFEHGESLFNAAVEEFATQGYEPASINTILTAAGMSKGQFYYYFEGKEDLYFALIEIFITQKQEYLRTVMRPEDFAQDIFRLLATQLRYGVGFALAYPALNRFAESFLRERGNAIYRRALQHFSLEDNSSFNKLIDAAYQRGEFRNDLPLSFIKKTIGFVATHAGELIDSSEISDYDRELEYIVHFLRAGLSRNDTS